MAAAKHIRLAGMLVVLSLLAAPATATPVIGINFEGDDVGNQPATDNTPGDPMTVPSAIGGYSTPTTPDPGDSPPLPGSGTILVGTPSAGSNEAVFTTNPTNDEVGALWMDVNGFNMPAQKIQLSFDLNILASATTLDGQPKFLGTNLGPQVGILFGMNTFMSDSSPAFRFAAAPTSAGGGVFAFRTPDNTTLIPFFDYVEGVQYSLSIVADYTTGKLDAFVNGNQELTNYAFLNSGLANASTSEFFFFLNGETGFANSVSLDNISAAAVPEAGSLLLFGTVSTVVGLAAAARSWKARRASCS